MSKDSKLSSHMASRKPQDLFMYPKRRKRKKEDRVNGTDGTASNATDAVPIASASAAPESVPEGALRTPRHYVGNYYGGMGGHSGSYSGSGLYGAFREGKIGPF